MEMVLSNEKRSDIIRHLESGEGIKDICKWFFVNESTVRRLWRRYKAAGCYKPLPLNNGRKPMVSEETMEKIIERIKEIPDMTLSEIVDEFELNISVSALCRRLIKRGLTFKKRRFIQKNNNGKTS
jgi:transposase